VPRSTTDRRADRRQHDDLAPRYAAVAAGWGDGRTFGRAAQDVGTGEAGRGAGIGRRAAAGDRGRRIDSPEEALLRLEAGAALVQIYSALVYEGPGLVRRILKRL
jgi:hypothetical protein